jgi:hypothetical protein
VIGVLGMESGGGGWGCKVAFGILLVFMGNGLRAAKRTEINLGMRKISFKPKFIFFSAFGLAIR